MRAITPPQAPEGVDEAPVSGVVVLAASVVGRHAQNDATSRQMLEGRVRPSERKLVLALAERFVRRFSK